MDRPYDSILASVPTRGGRDERMRATVDLLWDGLHATGVSWIGFYLREGDELTLGPRRDKPACSPIGLHGACGRALLSGRSLVVADVKRLGESYVACDPRDQSELVIPLFDERGQAWGVLDADSHALSAFGESDADGLTRLLLAAGLTSSRPRGIDLV
jgi:putative methionine-R-sulfoxide reductase with GAF domain